MYITDPAVHAVQDAILAILADRDQDAIAALRRIAVTRRPRLRVAGAPPTAPDAGRVRGRGIPTATRRAVIARDAYLCRYCGTWTMYTETLRMLSHFAGDAFIYQRHGNKKNPLKPICHDLYWTHEVTIDHRLPISYGGRHEQDNLITVCSSCQYARNNAPLHLSGLTVQPEPSERGWHGFAVWFPHLYDHYVARHGRPPLCADGAVDRGLVRCRAWWARHPFPHNGY